jgi:hypothetical protein
VGHQPPTRPGLQATLALGRVEAILLARNTLVLGGLVGAAIFVWYSLATGAPLWWMAGWQIGFGQMVISAVVLATAQLAAGRARRNNMEDLYSSFPVSARMRSAGHLLSVLGALPASVVLIGAASAVLEWRGVIGSANPAALAAGVLLVVAGGAIGVALGLRFPHPLVGALAALVWFASVGQSNQFNSPVTWLFPWADPDQLNLVPAPVPGYPPAGAHAVELAGVAALAGVVALAWHSRSAIQRGALLVGGGITVAVICVAGAIELQPIPTADLNRLVAEAANPASVQTCTTSNGVRYCLYPGFASLHSALQAPVNEVLAHVPARPAQALTIEQAVTSAGAAWSLDDLLTHGHSKAQISAWAAELNNAPTNTASASAIYLNVGTWPASGPAAAAARYDLALGAAEWALGLPPETGDFYTGSQCTSINQARAAIAIWLADVATRTEVGGTQGGDAYLLAEAMTALPEARVTKVLDRSWATWSNWRSTDAQLAAALGIPNAAPARSQVTSNAPPGAPAPPVCTQ